PGEHIGDRVGHHGETVSRSLPTGFLDAWNEAAAGQVPEADPANAELAINGTGTAAELATVPVPDRELAGRLRRDHLRFRGHNTDSHFLSGENSAHFISPGPPDGKACRRPAAARGPGRRCRWS